MKDLTYDELEAIIYNSKDWKRIEDGVNVEAHRWYNVMRYVYQNVHTEKYVIIDRPEANNETVDLMYEEYPAKMCEAEAYKVTVTKYRPAS